MNDSHNNSDTINVIGTVILILSIIAGIICGFAFQIPSYTSSLYYSKVEYSFNWTLCISIIISAILLKVTFSALACIARASEETTMMVYRLMCQFNDNDKKAIDNKAPIKAPTKNISSNNKTHSNSDKPNTWTCPKCGKINYHYVTTCTCGEPKPFDSI